MKERIIDTCYKLEYFRAQLYKLLEDIAKDYSVVEDDFDITEDVELIETTVTYDNEIIKIRIHDYLPPISAVSTHIKNRWIKSITTAITSLTNIKIHQKTMVYIVVSAPSKRWDIDNRHINLIINAVKYSRIIKDDNISYLAFGYEAVNSNRYFTDIYIFDDEKVHEKIPYIRKKSMDKTP